MDLEPINRRFNDLSELKSVEDATIDAVQSDPDGFLCSYRSDERSLGGRYISTDLFKEMFQLFKESNENRYRYNTLVHNSASVLASLLFRRMLADVSESNVETQRDVVIFLTGIPGSGKTSSVLHADQLMGSSLAVYELQLATPTIAIDKVKQVLDAGLKLRISVFHVLPEKALRNTLHRCDQCGRGASIELMARIQGGLPDSLAQVHARFGNRVDLWISDRRHRAHPRTLRGWACLSVLRSEGGYEDIKMRLHSALLRLRPRFSEAAHRSALGLSRAGGYDCPGPAAAGLSAPCRAAPNRPSRAAPD
jgi:hypothetical protein